MTVIWTLASVKGGKRCWLHDFSSSPLGGSISEQKLLLKEKRACKIHIHRKKIKRALVIYAEHTHHLIKSGFIEMKINATS